MYSVLSVENQCKIGLLYGFGLDSEVLFRGSFCCQKAAKKGSGLVAKLLPSLS